MKEENYLNFIGKRMPYTCPQDFLDNLEKNVWRKIGEEAVLHNSMRNRRLIHSISGGLVAASTTLLLLFSLHPGFRQTDNFEKVEQAFTNLDNTDRDYLLTAYQNDLFINEY